MREARGRAAAGRRGAAGDRARGSTRSAAEAADEIRRAGRRLAARSRVLRRAHVRYAGTDSALVVDFGDGSVATLRPRSRPRTAGAIAFLMPKAAALIVEAVSVEAIAAGDAPAEPRVGGRCAPTPRAGHRDRAHVQRGPLVGRGAGRARDAAPGPPRRRPGHHRGDERDHRRRAGLAGARDRARPPACCSASRRARSACAIGTSVDPVMLEVFNNLFMNIAEQMGAAAAEHRLLGQHQGAARLLVRAVRRRRQPDRQRAAHAGAPGLDGRVDQDRDARATPAACSRATSTCSTTRTTAARTCPTSPWSRRCSIDGGARHPVLRRLARPPRRRRRRHARLDAAVLDAHRGGGRADRQRQAGRARAPARGRDASRCSRAASIPARNPAQNIADLKAQIAANEKGVQELRKMVGAVRARRRAGLHGPRAGQRRGVGAPRHHAR